MYIPALDALREPALMTRLDADHQLERNQPPLNTEEWVKIPLDESLVVYAHMWDEKQ
ncbi:hypothetical protein KSD_19110 [Ktedonobacter sp. SOSP1-85]|nr:hypothetical protein KSC_055500 [Ktedonobacter sp. SOSP1-52]GHO74140.1 hypothetical protein KSD_19110 [Ktedonobacter sp. SOSP1-85]